MVTDPRAPGLNSGPRHAVDSPGSWPRMQPRSAGGASGSSSASCCWPTSSSARSIQAASQPASVTIPYDVFLTQVDAGNVVNITATGDSITGVARTAISGGSGQPKAKDFITVRPSFASDNLEAELIKQNVVTSSRNPTNPPTPLWETLLFQLQPDAAARLRVHLPHAPQRRGTRR